MKIAIYGISKNEINNVDGFMDSAGDTPVFILDHSTDGTAERFREKGATVDTTPITPFRWDHGKNAAMDLIPKEFDFVLNMDLDERLEPGAKRIFSQVNPKTTIVWHLYKPDHEIDRVRHDCRLHAREAYRWVTPYHEHLSYSADDEHEKIQRIDELLITHYPPKGKKHWVPDKLLSAVKEYPDDPRLRMLCGRDLYFDGRYGEAMDQFFEFLKMTYADKHDRSYVLSMMAKCQSKLKDFDYELDLLNDAAKSVKNPRREAWVELAYAYMVRGKHELCIKYSMNALATDIGEFAPNYDPGAWSFKPHEIMMISYYSLGRIREAIESGEIALKNASGWDAKRIADNLCTLRSAKRE